MKNSVMAGSMHGNKGEEHATVVTSHAKNGALDKTIISRLTTVAIPVTQSKRVYFWVWGISLRWLYCMLVMTRFKHFLLVAFKQRYSPLSSRFIALLLHVILNEWRFQYPPKRCTYSAVRLWRAWCHVKLLPSLQPYTTSRHFMQSHIRRVYECLAVACYLHVWQNDRDILRAIAVTRGS